MTTEHTPEPDFNSAADRRAYEKERLPDDLRDRVKTIEQVSALEKERVKKLQERWHERDMEKERDKIKRERPDKTYENKPWFMSSKKRRDSQEIDRSAALAVESKNTRALENLDTERDMQIDEVLALNRDRDPSLERDEQSIDAARQQKKNDYQITTYRGVEREDQDRDRER